MKRERKDAACTVRVPSAIKKALRGFAKSEARSFGNYVCKVLADHVAARDGAKVTQ